MQSARNRSSVFASLGRSRDRFRATLRDWILILTVSASLFAAPTQRRLAAQELATTEINQEAAIKAAFLYNFGRYIIWPESSYADRRAPFVIGVLGTDRLGASLDEIAANKQIEGRPIAVRRFATMADYKPCHVLFVAAGTPPAQRTEALLAVRRGGVLLVGEEAGFAQQGAMVNFFIEHNKVRFEINAAAAERATLKISSKLLGLAKIVGE